MGLPREGEGGRDSAYELIEAALNDDLGNPSGAGISLREEAIEKLTAASSSGWGNLVKGGLLFKPNVKNPPHPSSDAEDMTVWRDVYGHFIPHWDTGGWFPNISHETFLEAIGSGVLAALNEARSQADGGQQLPIRIETESSGSTNVSVSHTVSASELTLTISTPEPQKN